MANRHHTGYQGPPPEDDDAHDLMPAWLGRAIPALYMQERNLDPMVHAKFFDPSGSWTWYVLEYSVRAPDGTERLCFGYVQGFESELGYFSVDELEATTTAFGLHIERDLYFQPCPLSDITREPTGQ